MNISKTIPKLLYTNCTATTTAVATNKILKNKQITENKYRKNLQLIKQTIKQQFNFFNFLYLKNENLQLHYIVNHHRKTFHLQHIHHSCHWSYSHCCDL